MNRITQRSESSSGFSEAEKRVLYEFKVALRTRVPRSRLVVFGSRARGDAHEDSDLDVAVFVDSQRDRAIKQFVLDRAADFAVKSGVPLRALPVFGEELRGSGFLANIEQDGIEWTD